MKYNIQLRLRSTDHKTFLVGSEIFRLPRENCKLVKATRISRRNPNLSLTSSEAAVLWQKRSYKLLFIP